MLTPYPAVPTPLSKQPDVMYTDSSKRLNRHEEVWKYSPNNWESQEDRSPSLDSFLSFCQRQSVLPCLKSSRLMRWWLGWTRFALLTMLSEEMWIPSSSTKWEHLQDRLRSACQPSSITPARPLPSNRCCLLRRQHHPSRRTDSSPQEVQHR